MLARVAEGLLNRGIDASSVAGRHAASLEGKCLAVDVLGLSLRVELRIRAGRAEIASGTSGAADVTIKATPLELAKLAGADSVQRLKGSSVELNGDVHTAEAFAALLKTAMPDLERELADWIGDVPAHALGRRARALERWSAHSRAALEADVAEYVHEEGELAPRADEVRAYCAEVDRLRDDVERAAARLDRLVRSAAR